MNMNKKLEGHPISKVDPGSIGEELELEPEIESLPSMEILLKIFLTMNIM